MNSVLLDTWAVIAMIRKEQPAASNVRDLLANATIDGIPIHMSIINIGEVYYIHGQREGEEAAQQEIERLQTFLTEIIPADEVAVLAAAHYKLHHKLSYADAFAVAAAVERGSTILTGDPEIVALSDIVSVEPLVRERDASRSPKSGE